MKFALLLGFLTGSSLFALISILSTSPRKMILGWVGVGLLQSLFFLVIGFELIALLNLLFTVGSATVLKLYSSLYGSEETRRIERERTARTWIYGFGETLTISAVLIYAFSEIGGSDRFREDMEVGTFANGLVERFPELPWILGFILFLVIVVGATVGRPAWKRTQEEGK